MTASSRPVTAPAVRKRKGGDKLVMLTAYDTTMARLLDEAVDLLLVGDSLGCVVHGQPTTLGVTLDEMIYHSKMVTRGAGHALVVGDLPFGSYQVSVEDGLRSAIRLVKEAGVGAVKLEGGVRVQGTIEAIVSAGIPVMGHIGLTPQSYHAMGGHKVQGKTRAAAERLLADALAVEEAGAFAVVFEGIPAELAAELTARLTIPTIGIGAGLGCDGQVLVINDMLGFNEAPAPMRFNKEYASVRDVIREAVQRYAGEVRSGAFPEDKHSFSSPKATLGGSKALRIA